MKTTGAVIRSVAAWLVFGLGLISPLTPSEGHPGPIELALFVVGPALLLAWIGLTGSTGDLRVAGWVQFAAVVCIASYVLSAVFRS